jgi:urease accessory protein
VLPSELRHKSRLRCRSESGEEAAIFLEPGSILRENDYLLANDGRIVRVVAAAERVLLIEDCSATQLARAAYHLGNRHVPIQIGAGWLRFQVDHVLKDLLECLGFDVTEELAPFEPEVGAYGVHRHVS